MEDRIPIDRVQPGHKIRTDNGETHEVLAVRHAGDSVYVAFTCGCPRLIEAPSTLVTLVGL